jgi:hypothetical protein
MFHTGCSAHLWIDQISIDQSSAAEKAKQIAMMKSICENAEFVIGWLRYPSEDSNIEMDKINFLGELKDDHPLIAWGNEKTKTWRPF